MTASDVEEIGLVYDPADLPVDVAAEGRRVALTYRIVIDWSEELGFTATCAELPRLVARSKDATGCVETLFDQAAEQLATVIAHGLTPPPALRSSENSERPATPGVGVPPDIRDAFPAMMLVDDHDRLDDLIPPTLAQVQRMARWTSNQYRTLMHYSEGSYYATCPEVPAASGFGKTPNGCVDDLRRQLTRHVADLIIANRMPPEPLQDLERRTPRPKRRAA